MGSNRITEDKSEDDGQSLTDDMVYNKLEHECMISVGTAEKLVDRYVCCL
jgi:hypothetical protein